jgi:hypothetical protein
MVDDRSSLRRLEEDLARHNPLLLAAAHDVDATLLDWTLSLSPLDRLRVCSRAARALTGWRVTPDDR